MNDVPANEKERQISASYFISSNNRSFISNRHFAVYEPRVPSQGKAEQQQHRYPEEHFQDEEGNAISPLSHVQSQRFYRSEGDSDNSEAIIGNSNVRSERSLESNHSPIPQPTQHVPQHHLIIATSPSFESDSSTFLSGDDNDSLPSEAQPVRRPPLSTLSQNVNNYRDDIPDERNYYLAKLQSEITMLHQDVLGLKESINVLTRNKQKQEAARIRKHMASKYGNNTNRSFLADSSSLSGPDSIDVLIAECLHSVSETNEQSVSCSQEVKSLDQRLIQEEESENGARDRYQKRQRQRRQEEESRSSSIAATTTPRKSEGIVSPLGSVRTHDSLIWDGDQPVKRNLFLAGNTPCAKVAKRGREDAADNEKQKLIFLVFVCLASIAILMLSNERSQTNISHVPQPRQRRRYRMFPKKLTIDEQSQFCDISQEPKKYSSAVHCKQNQPPVAQDLLRWKSYREGKYRLDPWKAIVLSLRERNSNPWSENYSPLVSELTFWL